MRVCSISWSVLLLVLCLLSLAPRAHALPGEANAVIQRCGTPTGEDLTTSMLTGSRRRDLIYGSMILHFEPAGPGWSFTTAWYNHLPVTRSTVEARFPCFRRAMADAAAQPSDAIDPTIAQQMADANRANSNSFGVPLFGTMVILAVLLLGAIVYQYRRYTPEMPRTAEIRRVRRAPNLASLAPDPAARNR